MPIYRQVLSSKVAAVCLLLGTWLLHVAGVMSYVVREGRLSMVPIYGDVVYLIDGFNRLAVLDRAGILACLADFYAHPAHAPFVSMTSVAGLLLSGGHAWGPYLLNSLWILFLLGLGFMTLRAAHLWIKVGILLALLSVPMFGSVLAEFRPDPIWGLLAGFSVVFAASVDLMKTSRARLVVLGILFGAAVISKPSASPATVVVLACVVSTRLGLSLWDQRTSFRTLIKVVGLLTIGAACFIVPYFVSNGAGIFAYIREITGTGSIWKVQASWEQIAFYLNQGTGGSMLGWVWYAAIPIFAACLALLFRSGDRHALSAFAATMVGLVVVYVIVTVSGNKSLLTGSILYGTIIVAVVWCLGQIAVCIRLRSGVVVFLGALVFATFWTPRVATIQRADPAMLATDKANRALLPPLLEALRAGGIGTVLVTVPGPAYAGTLEFLAKQSGVSRRFVAGYTFNNWGQFAQAVSAADVVVLSEPEMRGQGLGYSFPSVQFQPRLLEALQADPLFKGSPVFTDEDHRSVWMFVRVKN